MFKSTLTRLRETRGIETGEAADAGFTLIELMVVLLIIAILLAIAIPTFLGVSGSANDRAAQSNLTNALTEVKALYQNSQSYNSTSLPVATLNASAPEFTWTVNASVPSEGTNTVSEYPVDVVTAADGAGVILAAYSKTATCWFAVDLEAAPVASFGTDTNGSKQFVSGTGAAQQELNSAAMTQAGVYYAKIPNATAAQCNANAPVNASAAWNWGTSYSNAPTS
jgi:type IV pilus assembly protein PilA